ncbi:DUF397 domain-containing protein [Streptomyces gamaensis]|uniref:DUF397 domain-containing protein n=1 Tax=Streptomyces gamaensis TaxID=1763542 RepID=A0ABW0Z8L4_9ACTN
MPATPRCSPSRPAPHGIPWRRSSYSTGMNNCVETAPELSAWLLAVRDSKSASGPVLLFPPAAWSSFVTHLCDSRLRPAPPLGRRERYGPLCRRLP